MKETLKSRMFQGKATKLYQKLFEKRNASRRRNIDKNMDIKKMFNIITFEI